jgi:GTPase SAR1 family protein
MRAQENPFRSTEIDTKPTSFARYDLDYYLKKLKELQCKAAILGEHGVGKSTLLCSLFRRLKDEGQQVVFLRACGQEEPGHLSDYYNHLCLVRAVILNRQAIIFLDGIDSMPFLLKEFVVSLSPYLKGLVVTSHRAERLSTLTVVTACPKFLARRIAELVNAPALDLSTLVSDLLNKHNNNYRSVFFALYQIATSCKTLLELQQYLLKSQSTIAIQQPATDRLTD